MPSKRDNTRINLSIVGISGSPRRGGNSDILLDQALEGASSVGARVDKIFISALDFKPCQACGLCDETGACMVPDDMRRVYKSIEAADAVIVASPVFFGSVTAQLKAMIDRFQGAWIAKYVLKNSPARKVPRKGYFLCACGSSERSFFSNAKKVVKNFFATIGAEYSGELFCGGIDHKGAVKNDAKILKKAFELGRKSADPL